MSLRRICFSALGSLGLLLGAASAESAGGGPTHNWQINMQPAVTPVMERLEAFDFKLLVIIIATCIFVAILLIYAMVRFHHRANPIPSKTQHHTLLEVVWTLVPILILAYIAIYSFPLQIGRAHV